MVWFESVVEQAEMHSPITEVSINGILIEIMVVLNYTVAGKYSTSDLENQASRVPKIRP